MVDDLCPGFEANAARTAARGCRPAPTCTAALTEASSRWPGRSRAGDGICGDAAHAARRSDHNPGGDGFAHAWDLTHDPGRGVDTYLLAARLRMECQSGRETRVKYLISNRRICSGPGWEWRPYGGPNPHTGHMHVSVTAAATHDTRPWFGFDNADGVDVLSAGWVGRVSAAVGTFSRLLGAS